MSDADRETTPEERIALEAEKLAYAKSVVMQTQDRLGQAMLDYAGFAIGDICDVRNPGRKEAHAVVIKGVDGNGFIKTYRINADGRVSNMSGGSYHYKDDRLIRRGTQE